MGFPADSIISTIFRNPIDEVARFLEHTHGGHYRVYNLCEGSYDTSKFNYQVATYPFADHHPPSLQLINQFMDDISSWLDAHPSNVAAVHCVGGKGRTGTMVCCWLLWSRTCKTTSEAVQMFADKRTRDGKGVIQPSQLRYIHIYDECLKSNSLRKCAKLTINSITTTSVPNFKSGGGCDPWFAVMQQGKRIYFSEPLKHNKEKDFIDFNDINVPVSGDICIDFYHKDFKKRIFSFSFHTNYIRREVLTLHKRELDVAFKDTKHKHFSPTFKVDVHFSGPALSRSLRTLTSSASEGSIREPLRARAFSAPPGDEHFEPLDGADEELAFQSREPVVCVECSRLIDTKSFFLDLSGKSYHWECLRCNFCRQTFSFDVKQCLIKKGGAICCDNCDELKNFFPDCAKCGQKVKGDPSASHEDQRWHSECFTCVVCNKSLVYESRFGFVPSPSTSSSSSSSSSLYPSSSSSSYPSASSYLSSPSLSSSNLFCVEHLPPHCDPVNNFNYNYDDETATISTLSFGSPSSLPFSSPLTKPSPPTLSPPLPKSSPLAKNSEATPFSLFSRSFSDGEISRSRGVGGSSIEIGRNKKHTAARGLYHSALVPRTTQLEEEEERGMSDSEVVTHSHSHFHPRNHMNVPLPSATVDLHPLKPSVRGVGTNEVPKASMGGNTSVGVFEFCCRCSLPIKDDFLQVNGQLYHANCLTCFHCGISLDDCTQVYEMNSQMYCATDFERLFGARCGKCGNLIDPGSPYLSACEKSFHVGCFTCATCGINLSDGVYFAKDDMPVCSKHKPGLSMEEALTLLVRTARDLVLGSPSEQVKRFVELSRALTLSVKNYLEADPHSPGCLHRAEEEVSLSHSNFLRFCVGMFVDEEAQEYLMMRRREFQVCGESFVDSTNLLKKMMKFNAAAKESGGKVVRATF